MRKFCLMLLACAAAFSLAPPCSASPKGRPVRRPPLTHSIDARDWFNISFPITEAPPPPPSSTVPENIPTSTCQTYNCNIFYQYVSIFYWPSESQNTACLASLASPPPTAIPSGLSSRISPSIYAIFPSIMASDGCNQIGKGYGPITTSFAPGELSTIDIGGRSTNVFNFADLPCPPSGIDVPPGETYAPLIAPPSFIWDLDPAFSGCVPGYSQGVDPPTAFTGVPGLDGPGDGAPPRRRDQEVLPWGPTRTAGPAPRIHL